MHKQSDKLAQFYRDNEALLTVDDLPTLKRLSYYDRAQLSDVEHRPRVDPAKVMRWTGRVPLGLIERSLWATLENRIGVLSARQRVKRFGETLGNDYEWVCIPRVMRRLLRAGMIKAAANEVYEA